MNVNLEKLIKECRARGISVDDVMGALSNAIIPTFDLEVDFRTPASPVDQAAPAPPSAARAAPPVAPPPPVTREWGVIPAADQPLALAQRVPNASAAGSPYVDAAGANWRDATGAWFDPAAHAWNRAGHPAVTPAGKFRAKRAGSAAPPAPVETKAPAAETTGAAGGPGELSNGDTLDLALQLKECSEVHGLTELEQFETHFATLFDDWQTGNAAEQAAYREVEIAIDAKRQELTERLTDETGQEAPAV
jgi:hypothetical protein